MAEPPFVVKRHPKIARMHSESMIKLEVIKKDRPRWDTPPPPASGRMDIETLVRKHAAEAEAKSMAAPVPVPVPVAAKKTVVATASVPNIPVSNKPASSSAKDEKKKPAKVKPNNAATAVASRSPVLPERVVKEMEQESLLKQQREYRESFNSKPGETRNFGAPPKDFINSVDLRWEAQKKHSGVHSHSHIGNVSGESAAGAVATPTAAHHHHHHHHQPQHHQQQLQHHTEKGGISREKPSPDVIEALLQQQRRAQESSKRRHLEEALRDRGLALFDPQHPYVADAAFDCVGQRPRRSRRQSRHRPSSSAFVRTDGAINSRRTTSRQSGSRPPASSTNEDESRQDAVDSSYCITAVTGAALGAVKSVPRIQKARPKTCRVVARAISKCGSGATKEVMQLAFEIATKLSQTLIPRRQLAILEASLNDRDSEREGVSAVYVSRRLSKICTAIKDAVNTQNMSRLEAIAMGVEQSLLIASIASAAPFAVKSSDICIGAFFIAAAVIKVADGECKDKFMRQLLGADGVVFLLAASRMYMDVDDVTGAALEVLAALLAFADSDSSDLDSRLPASMAAPATLSSLNAALTSTPAPTSALGVANSSDSPVNAQKGVGVVTAVHQALVHGGTTLLCRFLIYYSSDSDADRVEGAIQCLRIILKHSTPQTALKICSAYGGRFTKALVGVLQTFQMKTKLCCLELIVALIACCDSFVDRISDTADLKVIINNFSLHGNRFDSEYVSALWATQCMANVRKTIQDLKNSYQKESSILAGRPHSAPATRGSKAAMEIKVRLQVVVGLLESLREDGSSEQPCPYPSPGEPIKVSAGPRIRSPATSSTDKRDICTAKAAAAADADAGVAADDDNEGDDDSRHDSRHDVDRTIPRRFQLTDERFERILERETDPHVADRLRPLSAKYDTAFKAADMPEFRNRYTNIDTWKPVIVRDYSAVRIRSPTSAVRRKGKGGSDGCVLLCDDDDMRRLLDKETLDGLSDTRFTAIHLFGRIGDAASPSGRASPTSTKRGRGHEGGWSFLRTSSKKVYKQISGKGLRRMQKAAPLAAAEAVAEVTYLRMVDDLVGSPQEGPLEKLSFAERLKVMVMQLSAVEEGI